MTNGSKITLEMLNVDRVEPDDGAVKSDVQFCQGFAEHEWASVGRYNLFDFVESTKDWNDAFVVGLLVWGKSSLIHSCVEVVLHPGGDVINLDLMLSWIKIKVAVGNGIEGMRKPAKLLCAFLPSVSNIMDPFCNELTLLTMVFVFLSHSKGTEYLPLYSLSALK